MSHLQTCLCHRQTFLFPFTLYLFLFLSFYFLILVTNFISFYVGINQKRRNVVSIYLSILFFSFLNYRVGFLNGVSISGRFYLHFPPRDTLTSTWGHFHDIESLLSGGLQEKVNNYFLARLPNKSTPAFHFPIIKFLDVYFYMQPILR